eukprot:COSAG02_NODE_8949_length_2387_cov_1.855332_1_plen_48_part_10
MGLYGGGAAAAAFAAVAAAAPSSAMYEQLRRFVRAAAEATLRSATQHD